MKLKKILATVSAVALSISMSFTAFAADLTGLSQSEKQLYNYLTAGVVAGSFNYQFEKADLNKAISYMQANELSQEDVDIIIAQIDEAKALIKSKGITKMSDIDTNTAKKLVEIANVAGSIVNVEFGLDAKGNIEVIGANGENYTTIELNKTAEDKKDAAEKPSNGGTDINKTGFGLEATAAVVALLTVTLASCAIYAKKRTVEA